MLATPVMRLSYTTCHPPSVDFKLLFMGNPGLLAELFATKSEEAGWFRDKQQGAIQLWWRIPNRQLCVLSSPGIVPLLVLKDSVSMPRLWSKWT